MKKTRIWMGIPSTGQRLDAQVYALRRIEKKYADKIELVYPELFCQRIFHDYARNEYTREFLDSDCDMIWFLDSDVLPPDDVLDIVVEHQDKWQCAGAPYPVWMTPPGYKSPQVVFTVYKKNEHGLYASLKVPLHGTEFVAGLGTGCMFIKREVFDKLNKPYFEFKYREDNRHMEEGEDLGFCRKMSTLGIEFFVDYTKTCSHFKSVNLVDVNNYAIEFAQKTVIANDRAIRQEIAKRKLGLSQPKQSTSLILPK